MKFWLLFFVFFPSLVDAQVLNNQLGLAFTDQPFFNTDFISNNKVKQIKGQFTYKRIGEAMRSTEFSYVYHFDSLGRLDESYETRKDDGTTDTTRNIYEYDSLNQLLVHRKNDANGYTSIQFVYDSLGHSVQELHYRDFKDSTGKITQRLLMNHESMKIELYDTVVKRIKFNSYELPYSEEFTIYNQQGYLLEVSERYRMASGYFKKFYTYNEKGLLASVKFNENGDSLNREEWHFKYDNFNNLMEKQLYRNGVFVTEFQILYNDQSHLLSAVLTRDVATNFIMILRFQEYSFY